jgi:hypothetical protein
MKPTTISTFFQRLLLAVTATFITMITFAQDADKKVDINVSTNKDNFWASPWVWVIGGAVFVLLLAAILRGNSGSRRDA